MRPLAENKIIEILVHSFPDSIEIILVGGGGGGYATQMLKKTKGNIHLLCRYARETKRKAEYPRRVNRARDLL